MARFSKKQAFFGIPEEHMDEIIWLDRSVMTRC